MRIRHWYQCSRQLLQESKNAGACPVLTPGTGQPLSHLLSRKGVPRPRLEQPRAWSSATRPGLSLTEKPAPLTATRAARVHPTHSPHASKPPATSAPGNSFRGCVSLRQPHAGSGTWERACPDLRTRNWNQSACPGLKQDLTATLRRLSAGHHGNGTGLWNPEVAQVFWAHASS